MTTRPTVGTATGQPIRAIESMTSVVLEMMRSMSQNYSARALNRGQTRDLQSKINQFISMNLTPSYANYARMGLTTAVSPARMLVVMLSHLLQQFPENHEMNPRGDIEAIIDLIKCGLFERIGQSAQNEMKLRLRVTEFVLSNSIPTLEAFHCLEMRMDMSPAEALVILLEFLCDAPCAPFYVYVQPPQHQVRVRREDLIRNFDDAMRIDTH